MKFLPLFLFSLLACAADRPTGPPCRSTTGTRCHAAEVAAWSRCCDLPNAEALECQIDAMWDICSSGFDCSSVEQYDHWSELDACTQMRTEAACPVDAPACPL